MMLSVPHAAEEIAFSIALAFLAARVEVDPRLRERLEDATWAVLQAAHRAVRRKPRRRRGRSQQLPLFYPLDHQIRLKFRPLGRAID